MAGLHLVVHSSDAEVKASRIRTLPLHRISWTPWNSAEPCLVMRKVIPLKIQPWYFLNQAAAPAKIHACLKRGLNYSPVEP